MFSYGFGFGPRKRGLPKDTRRLKNNLPWKQVSYTHKCVNHPPFLPLSVYVLSGTKLKTFHGDLPYTSSEIIEKLECLTEEDVVGTGGFGTVYRMVMNDCATFAVKRIDRSREGCDEVFEMELEILGSVKHINLVNLRGYCRLPNAKLLIYDYLALGSLDDFLHGMILHLYLCNFSLRHCIR